MSMRSALQVVYPDLIIPPTTSIMWQSPEVVADPRLWCLIFTLEGVSLANVEGPMGAEGPVTAGFRATLLMFLRRRFPSLPPGDFAPLVDELIQDFRILATAVFGGGEDNFVLLRRLDPWLTRIQRRLGHQQHHFVRRTRDPKFVWRYEDALEGADLKAMMLPRRRRPREAEESSDDSASVDVTGPREDQQRKEMSSPPPRRNPTRNVQPIRPDSKSPRVARRTK